MSSRKILARTLIICGIGGLVALSLRGPDRHAGDLFLLMEPDGTGIWHQIIDDFQRKHPNIRVQLVEGPAATDARSDMYSTSFYPVRRRTTSFTAM